MLYMNRLVLIKPSKEYKDAIIEMLDEWSSYNATHVTDPSPRAIFHDYSDFDAYLAEFVRAETKPKPEHVPATTYFALDEQRNKIVGAICIRHYLTEALLNSGGHIGDGVRPSERGKGYGKEILRLALKECKYTFRIKKVLISAHSDNIASIKAIEANGGIFDKTVMDDGKPLQLYWVHLDGHTKYTQNDLALDIETLRKKRFMNLISEEKFEEEKHELAQKYLADKDND